jgi:hypothetical protein
MFLKKRKPAPMELTFWIHQWLFTRVILPFPSSGDIRQHLGSLLTFLWDHNWDSGAISTYWVEARNTVKSPAMHRVIQCKISIVPRLKNSDIYILCAGNWMSDGTHVQHRVPRLRMYLFLTLRWEMAGTLKRAFQNPGCELLVKFFL